MGLGIVLDSEASSSRQTSAREIPAGPPLGMHDGFIFKVVTYFRFTASVHLYLRVYVC